MDGIIEERWRQNFVSGGNSHWMQIALQEEIFTYGVKITTIKTNKALDIFQKTYVSAGMNPTTLSQDEDTSELQTHNELSVYYEGPADQGAEIYLKFDKPVKTKYIFMQASPSIDGKWGFSEVEVMSGEYWLSYCANDDPLEGIENYNKASVGLFAYKENHLNFITFSLWMCHLDG